MGCLDAVGEGCAAPGVELRPSMVTAWERAQVSVRSVLWFPGFKMFRSISSVRN